MDVVLIIIIGIVVLQVYLFYKNLQRMHEFRDIFSEKSTWNISRSNETGFVNGIFGDGNSTFQDIRHSINKYLSGSSGSVIDYNLLKDAVDRHCDSVENDISTQTPVPLYCGLAGTMVGVIIGLASLLHTGSISSLLGANNNQNKQNIEVVDAQTTEQQNESSTRSQDGKLTNYNKQNNAAAEGVNDLLSGVAYAMIASICGIILTTISSLLFKKNKLEEESGKNEFLAWMQSVLLPELPSDTSDALNKLVKNLNSFNNTFSTNTADLGKTLTKVNESYKVQAEIIQTVHDMDVMKMAWANVKVLEKLQGCTDELAQFQSYLESINGYTTEIQRFTELFHNEADRVKILEEIRDFFIRHKSEIAKEVTDEDDALQEALNTLRDTSSHSITELNGALTAQIDQFRDTNQELLETLTKQLGAFPQLYQHIEEISKIPPALKQLTNRMQQNNADLVKHIQNSNDSLIRQIQAKVEAVQRTPSADGNGSTGFDDNPTPPDTKTPRKFLWVVGFIIIVITCFFLCGINYCTYREIYKQSSTVMEHLNKAIDTTAIANPIDTVSAINFPLRRDSNHTPTGSTKRIP